MGYFVVFALDKADSAAIRAQHRPAHRHRLRQPEIAAFRVHVGGPVLNEADEMIGTMLIIEADNQTLVEDFVLGDPYTKAGLFETINIHPFNWGLGSPEEARNG